MYLHHVLIYWHFVPLNKYLYGLAHCFPRYLKAATSHVFHDTKLYAVHCIYLSLCYCVLNNYSKHDTKQCITIINCYEIMSEIRRHNKLPV